MKIRFINARILTMEEDRDIFFGELWVEGNLITYVGPKKETKTKFDRVIDCNGNLLMPGFKNAHAHSPMTFLRSYVDDLPLDRWLNEAVFPLEDKLLKEDIYHLSKVAFAEYVSSGITAAFDMYYHPLEIAKAARDTGFRSVLIGTITENRETIEELKENYRVINSMSPLVKYYFGFHAEYTSTPEILRDLSKAANDTKSPIFTHISETEKEVEGCISRHGMTPAAYFDSLGLFNYGGGGYHGVAFRDIDFEIFKKRNLSIVTCPSSNTKLASGIAPIKRYLDEGINVAIGTDGPASNNCLDMFREMFLVTGLAKIRENDASVVDAYDVIKMATVNGSIAMGLDNADILAPNKLADLIMIDLKQPNMQPMNNIVKNIVYAGSKSNIYLTMINGKILYEDGKFYLDEDIETIYKNAQTITDRITKD
ncbi:MAG: amidohydrolase family protein [Bacilli bacterium]|jgi:5-methylthioadenosine/S-adenosylhomocysteine deaminase